MKMLLKLWTVLGMSTVLLTGVGNAYAASAGTSQSEKQNIQIEKFIHDKKYENQLLSLLKIDGNTLEMQLAQGKSLADIANSENIKEQKVVELFRSFFQESIDSAVGDGMISKAQANEKLADFTKVALKIINHKPQA